MSNPYGSPFHAWSDDVKHAHKLMPRTVDGFVVNPKFIPKPGIQADLTARWRKWAERFPQRLHPVWLASWFAEAEANEKRAAA